MVSQKSFSIQDTPVLKSERIDSYRRIHCFKFHKLYMNEQMTKKTVPLCSFMDIDIMRYKLINIYLYTILFFYNLFYSSKNQFITI